MLHLNNNIFNILNDKDFYDTAIKIFHYQVSGNPVYREFVKLRKIDHGKITELTRIPFLPATFFKTHKIITGTGRIKKIFYSSGTQGKDTSKHYLTDIKLYKRSLLTAFQIFYSNIKDYCILALLPGYLEQKSSSLVYMIKTLIHESGHPAGGFYLYEHSHLKKRIIELELKQQKFLLFGVSYALLDFSEKNNFNLRYAIVMETGGMKGNREEITKDELHKLLTGRFGVDCIHSEYGMTELLSQAYSKGGNCFRCPPWMKVMIRDINDPYNHVADGKTGGINIIDLGNINSCAFVETGDLGRKYPDGTFEVLGRITGSDIRGCNQMI
ncbi:MAG: acyl transferase [Bacteroidia bacterium]|nr:acyl transferase [Bacteroidia bacterium]